MAIFRKVIVRPGVFHVTDGNGKRRIKAITSDFIKSVCKTAKEMIGDGMKIPSPFAHKDNGNIIPGPLVEGEKDAFTLENKKWSSDVNAGFWQDFEVDEKNQLVGYVDIPDELDSKKVSKTIRETSIYIDPERIDGKGKTRVNAIRHVALVTNPIEHSQDNFVRVDSEYPLAMSFSMSDEVASNSDDKEDFDSDEGDDTSETTTDDTSSITANISELVTLVKDKLGYEMPSDTDEKNFLDRLRTILVSIQKDSNNEEDEDLEKKPEGAKTESSPVIMADEQDNVVILNKANKLLESLIAGIRLDWTSKVQALIAKGKIGKKYAESTLYPAIESFSMSLEDYNVETGELANKPAIVMSLEMLDSANGINDFEKPEGETQEIDNDIESMTDKEAEALYAQII